jgi:hypothetical protein
LRELAENENREKLVCAFWQISLKKTLEKPIFRDFCAPLFFLFVLFLFLFFKMFVKKIPEHTNPVPAHPALQVHV